VEQTYIVQNGDTPAAIADQFNVSPDALLQENNITDPRTLRVGQVLKIPTATQRR
jgi:LysM repeat protein